MQQKESLFWNIGGGHTIHCNIPRIAGIVNCTNNSFVEGSYSTSLTEVLAMAKKHKEHGADIIDIGAVSTKPNAPAVDEEEEKERVCSLIDSIKKDTFLKDTILSIDSTKVSVISAVLDYGCNIVNDVSGLMDISMVDILCQYLPGYVLMYTSRVSGNTKPSIADMLEYFEKKMNLLSQRGFPEKNIVLDIGLGFGYTYPYSLEIIKNLKALQNLGRPLFLGISHKTWYQSDTALSFLEKECATMLSVALLKDTAHIFRVHTVGLAKRALYIAQQLG